MTVAVTRKSLLSKVVRTVELPITEEQLSLYEEGYNTVQDIFPHLNPHQREFIMTGITEDEWDSLVGYAK